MSLLPQACKTWPCLFSSYLMLSLLMCFVVYTIKVLTLNYILKYNKYYPPQLPLLQTCWPPQKHAWQAPHSGTLHSLSLPQLPPSPSNPPSPILTPPQDGNYSSHLLHFLSKPYHNLKFSCFLVLLVYSLSLKNKIPLPCTQQAEDIYG